MKAAEGEARVSAREVAALAQRAATAEDSLEQVRERLAQLELRCQRAETEHKASLVQLQRAQQDAKLLESQLAELRTRRVVDAPPPAPAAPPEVDRDAGEMMLLAARAAEELRAAAREEARVLLKKARERAEEIERTVARERQDSPRSASAWRR